VARKYHVMAALPNIGISNSSSFTLRSMKTPPEFKEFPFYATENIASCSQSHQFAGVKTNNYCNIGFFVSFFVKATSEVDLKGHVVIPTVTER